MSSGAMIENTGPQREVEAPERARMDFAFLKRSFWASMAITALAGAAGPVYVGFGWAGHYLAAGLWMNANAVLLAGVLLAYTARPMRVMEVAIFGNAKVIWFACLIGYCWALKPSASALLLGLMTLPFVFFLKALGWAWVNVWRTAPAPNDNTEPKN